MPEDYNMLQAVSEIISKLYINPEIIESDQKIKTLSGGEKVKIQIAKIMINKPDLLLFDESTNDLDIETFEWLESFIKNNNIPIIFVSHDRKYIKEVCNIVYELKETGLERRVDLEEG